MSEVTFYHTEREDNGRRTGLAVNGFIPEGMETFVPGDDDDFNPAIRWYVDVRCPVEKAPKSVRNLRVWFQEHADRIQAALEEVALRLEAGLDQVGSPWSFEMDSPMGSVHVSVSAQRRYEAQHISESIRRVLKSDWKEYQAKHQPLAHAKP
jgi:hypothetical protein